jgi:hypothetical protein
MVAMQMPVYRSVSEKRDVLRLHKRLLHALMEGEEAAVAEIGRHLAESDRKRRRALRSRKA